VSFERILDQTSAWKEGLLAAALLFLVAALFVVAFDFEITWAQSLFLASIILGVVGFAIKEDNDVA